MPGLDETIPPPPRDPAEDAAREAKRQELEARLPELEARVRAAMTDDIPDACLREAADDLLRQIENDPGAQARKDDFFRRLANGQFDGGGFAEGGDVPPGANAEDCPYCGTDLPYPWICTGHPEAYARAMDLARGDAPAEPDVTEFDQVINEYTRIGEKAFNAARRVDVLGQPVYDDFADWYANGDWDGNEEGGQR